MAWPAGIIPGRFRILRQRIGPVSLVGWRRPRQGWPTPQVDRALCAGLTRSPCPDDRGGPCQDGGCAKRSGTADKSLIPRATGAFPLSQTAVANSCAARPHMLLVYAPGDGPTKRRSTAMTNHVGRRALAGAAALLPAAAMIPARPGAVCQRDHVRPRPPHQGRCASPRCRASCRIFRRTSPPANGAAPASRWPRTSPRYSTRS